MTVELEPRHTLRILQYNVEKSKNKVMVPLFASNDTKTFDIVAIQEPWRNPFSNTSYNPRAAGFSLAYNSHPHTRACTYVNNSIDPSSWTIPTLTPDFVTIALTLRAEENRPARRVLMHNLYHPRPPSTHPPEAVPTFQQIRQAIQNEPQADHIVLGDFNLHHPRWGGSTCVSIDQEAETLIDVMNELQLTCILPPGTITRRRGRQETTIDLAWVSAGLRDTVVLCAVDPAFDQDSDHLPIVIELMLRTESTPPKKGRNWNKANYNALHQYLVNHQPLTRALVNPQDIDTYADELTIVIQEAISHAVPWAKPSQYARTGWTEECTRAVKSAKRLRRRAQRTGSNSDMETYRKAVEEKTKIIQSAMRTEFRNGIAQAAEDPTKLWRLVKWARERNDQGQRQLPQFPPIFDVRANHMQHSLDEKVTLLRNQFFPPPEQADRTDIDGYNYPNECELLPDITEREVYDAIFESAPKKPQDRMEFNSEP